MHFKAANWTQVTHSFQRVSHALLKMQAIPMIFVLKIAFARLIPHDKVFVFQDGLLALKDKLGHPLLHPLSIFSNGRGRERLKRIALLL